MSVNLGLLIVVGLMAACGVYLLLERSLVKMLLGLLLVGNAINLLIIVVVLIVNFTVNKLTGASIDKGVGG